MKVDHTSPKTYGVMHCFSSWNCYTFFSPRIYIYIDMDLLILLMGVLEKLCWRVQTGRMVYC